MLTPSCCLEYFISQYIHRNFPLRTLNNFQVVFGGVVGIVFYAIQVLSFSSDNNPPTVQETLTSISLAGLLLGNLVLLPKFYTSFIDVRGAYTSGCHVIAMGRIG